MDRVGGYLAYLALLDDERAFEDVVIAMNGEDDARRIVELERKANK